MFKVGAFSRFSSVTSQTLRHWDRIDLLKPNFVDEVTGYRFYTAQQLYEVNRILALQAMGLSLKQIRDLVSEQVSAQEIRSMFRLKRLELKKQMQEVQKQMQMLESRLGILDEAGLSHQVSLKSVEVKEVLAASFTSDSQKDFQVIFIWFMHRAVKLQAEWTAGLLATGDAFSETNVSYELFLAPKDQLIDQDKLVLDDTVFTKKSYAKQLVARTVHHGTMFRIPEAYAALGQWISVSKYEVDGYIRELFHVIANPSSPRAQEAVFEIQIPVKPLSLNLK